MEVGRNGDADGSKEDGNSEALLDVEFSMVIVEVVFSQRAGVVQESCAALPVLCSCPRCQARGPL